MTHTRKLEGIFWLSNFFLNKCENTCILKIYDLIFPRIIRYNSFAFSWYNHPQKLTIIGTIVFI